MSIRHPSPTVWLAALAAVAVAACASQPAAEPVAKPVASSAAASPTATAVASVPTTPPPAFVVCGACHGATANANPSLGPNLFGIVGRKAGSVADYDYSPALKEWGQTWTVENLAAFVHDPSKAVPGNNMDYGGTDEATAKAIAAYMTTLK